MTDEKLAELRKLAGPDYVVFRRTDYEQRKRELEEIAGVDVIRKKRVLG